MPRRSGGGGFGGRSSSRSRTPPPRQTSTRQAPPPRQQAPPQQQQGQRSGGMFSGLGSMMMTGMAFGAGSEVAHQAVRGVMGSGSGHGDQQQVQQQQYDQSQQQQQQQQQVCQDEQLNFARCLQDNNDISSCQTYVDMLKECQNRSYKQ